MKQREDNLTADMFGNEPPPTTCMLYVETHSGECIEWGNLTLTKAKQMYAYTNQVNPCNVKSSGWEAVK